MSDKQARKKRKAEQNGERAHKKKRREEGVKLKKSSKIPSQPLFHLETYSLWAPIAPIAALQPLEGACAEYLSPMLLTHHPLFRGIVLAYENVRLSEQVDEAETPYLAVLAQSSNEYAGSFVWITADFTIFRPLKNASIDGHISVQAHSHLGLICWNLFNASIPRERLPKDWKWVQDGENQDTSHSGQNGRRIFTRTGHYIDGAGNEVNDLLRFKIYNVEVTRTTEVKRGFVNIEGTLIKEVE
ncbi:MAG: hypothetical protein M1820_008856 [Bogoriella megaspora]|nr:MAG: hypothetical protein M1820_008856 [Bogoriella megaspora]